MVLDDTYNFSDKYLYATCITSVSMVYIPFIDVKKVECIFSNKCLLRYYIPVSNSIYIAWYIDEINTMS